MKSGAQPDLKWIFWRWPQHTYSPGSFEFPNRNLKLTIQWMVRDNIVLQQCLIENNGNDDVKVDVRFHKSLCIRDLDHFDRGSKFNKGNSIHHIRTGPKGVSCVFTHTLEAGHPSKSTPATSRLRPSNTIGSEDSQIHEGITPLTVPSSSKSVHGDVFAGSNVPILRQEGGCRTCGRLHEDTLSEDTLSEDDFSEDTFSEYSNTSNRSRPAEIRATGNNPQDDEKQSKNSLEISVISSVTIDGKAQRFEDKPGPQKWSLVVKGRLMSGLDGRAKTCEVIAAYEMKKLTHLESDSQAEIIPLGKMKFSRFLRDQKLAHLPLLRVPALGTTRTPKHGEGDEAAAPQTHDATMNHPVGDPGKSSRQNIPGAPQNHLAFAARRNLEHLLSACTIQATPDVSDIDDLESLPEALHDPELKSVAFTCGDMYGHRICWSSSL